MIVVADTSPLSALFQVGRLDLLERLFGEVFIPPEVAREAGDPASRLPLDVLEHAWIHVQAPSISAPADIEDLDPGERDAITLALEIQAGIIVIDEKEARRRAEHLGLEVIGVLGILLAAKAKGLIRAVEPLIADLRARAAFRMSDRLIRKVLEEAGEV